MKTLKLLKVFCIFIAISVLSYMLTYENFANFDEILKSRQKISICGRFPLEKHITIDNLIWQVMEHPKGFVKILNAYLDLRQNKSVIRINVNSPAINKSDIFYCQFWYDEKGPTVVQVTDILGMKPGNYEGKNQKSPFLLECPFTYPAPTSVSLVANSCDFAENNLKIIDVQPADGVKKRFGVCSKQVSFQDRAFTVRFIEWVHMMRLLGAEKIHFHYQYIHPDMFDVIKYFEKQGIIETWPYFDPSGIIKIKVYYPFTAVVQKNMLTDCFYRVKNLYDYVAILDFDEVIMPVHDKDMTWEDIITRVNATEYMDAYVSRNFWFPDVGTKPIKEIPSYMHMLQHVHRSKNASKPGADVKSLFGTERVLAIHNHYPHFCINKGRNCVKEQMSTEIAQNSHYQSNRKDIEETVVDKKIWKYKDQLIAAVQKTLKETRFRI